jgi:outer membrane protein TolC
MRRYVILLFLLGTGNYLAWCQTPAQDTTPSGQVTLEECQNKARENYPLINQYELIEQAKEYSLSNAAKAYLPQLDVTLIGGIIDGLPSFSPPGAGAESSGTVFNMIGVLQLNQTIWDGGITKAKKGVIEASAAIEKADLEVSLYSLEDRINNLFFGTLLIDEQLAQIEILKLTLNRNLKRVEIAVENGTAFKSDIDEILVEVINTEQKWEELKYNRLAYITVLAAMIGEPINESNTFVRPPLDDSYKSMALNRPELALFSNKTSMVEAQSRIDKGMIYPKIGFMGFGTFIQPGVDFGSSTLNNILVVGLSVNWNLGSLYRNGNNKKLTEVNLLKINLQRETFVFNTGLLLTQTERELEKFETIIAQDKELLALKSRIKQAYDIKYENGVSTMSDLLDRVNDESIAIQNLVVHEIQYLMKAYQYKNNSGN